MDKIIDPRDVLTHLNEMGFTNINAHQLKDFIIDLKKLIKHDARYHNVTHPPPTSKGQKSSFSYYESDYCDQSDTDETLPETFPQNKPKDDSKKCTKSLIKSQKEKAVNTPSLQAQSTAVSQPEENQKKNKLISVHIQKRPTEIIHEHCIHIGPSTMHSQNIPRLHLSSSGKEITTESSLRRPESNQTSQPRSSCATTCLSRPKTTFIKQTAVKPAFNKCDPVALFHYYQSQWKRTKIPGQDSRDDLRWAIREKMLGGPKVEVKPILRKRCSSYSVGSSWR